MAARRNTHEQLRGLSLFWQIFLPNAAVLVAAGVVLALSPGAASSNISSVEAGELAVGLVAILVVNRFLIRRALAPLQRLTATMSAVDPLVPGTRASTSGGSAETKRLAAVLNTMLERLETDRKESAARMLSAQERERVRLARELHDEIGQSMTGLVLELGRAATEASPEQRPEIEELRETARMIGDELRRIVRRLRPEALDDLGLRSALVALTERFSEQAGIPVERSLSTDLPPLGADAELVVYRVAQESLTNVARHSGASRVLVELEESGTGAVLRVSDDGNGMEGMSPGTGIEGMRERAMLVGGGLRIANGAEGGAEVLLSVPTEAGS